MDRRGKGEERTAWLFITPFLVMFAIFKLYPILYGFLVSFWNRNAASRMMDRSFVGLANYLKVLQSASFWAAFGRSLEFSLVYTVTIMVLGVMLAVLLNRRFPGRTFVRTCWYIPYVTNMIAIGIVFRYLLNPSKGPVNALWRVFGTSGPQWLNDPHLALPVSAVIGAWVALAFTIITILAGLQDIPKEWYEVADLEGATFWQRLVYVTLPALVPTLFLMLTIAIINSFRSYTTIVGLTNGGPGTASMVLSLQIYNDAFLYQKFSIASAEGVLFTAFIVLINQMVAFGRGRWEKD
ncbi:MAG: sugar ABC transporter permease [Sphaerochaeta sp.]|jgi:multiple sugar transport system permease protein|nr:sugar ABC transporter permease [Sphaerochaeta sp.]